jgi:hypothetical protein
MQEEPIHYPGSMFVLGGDEPFFLVPVGQRNLTEGHENGIKNFGPVGLA